MPYHVEDEGLEAFVPASFATLVSMFIAETLEADSKLRDINDALAQATLTVTYSDIGGQEYAQSFRASVTMAGYAAENADSSAKLYGTLDFLSTDRGAASELYKVA